MKELWEILTRIEQYATHRQPAALCTVISTSGSTYRRPGARLVVAGSDSLGAVSAGCLEDEVISIAQRVLSSGRPQLMRFDTTEEMDKIAGTGLGCRGTIEVFIEPLPPDGGSMRIYRELRQALLRDRICHLAIELKTARHALLIDGKLCMDELQEPQLLEAIRRASMLKRHEILQAAAERTIYLERIEPPLNFIVFGAGYDAIPLVRFAHELGFRVLVVDHRPQYLTQERFPQAAQLLLAHPRELPERIQLPPGAFVVIMTHHYLYDREILKLALRSEASYIGQIGPRSRTQELLAEITKEIGPLPDEKLACLHAPVGLDLGAETPEEIAISILGEVLAVRNKRAAGFLRGRRAPIHADEL